MQHRFCSWHIKKHELQHLQPYVARYSDFQESYKEWVKSDRVEEFESRWEVIRGKYNLESNFWVNKMYNQRKYWAKAFLKDIFFAGMTTSEWSESIHSFFDGYVNSRTMLNEFVIQYNKAVDSYRVAKVDEDFKIMNSRAVLSFVHPIESKAGKTTEEIKYRVGQLDIDKRYWGIVSFRFLNQVNVTYSCGPASELTSIFELVSNPASFLEHVSVFYTTLEFVLALE
ncbi:protein FAR1-RELATED SEQUENCE 5-like [Lactuca sativa]|uniref:protein FAR1-RELATED SEQUENCE 5-like n=1 Tax=Lactuca sativa TaxID=4236 RepID=UPI000CD967F9|nr:protein FAR1-RELATED SEQUENCE 5-like [Lactuca sativa]